MQNGSHLFEALEESGRTKSHKPDYILLTLLIAIAAYFYFAVAFTDSMKFYVIAVLALGYLLWGIIHHRREETLTWGIMLEYHALALLVISVFIPIHLI